MASTIIGSDITGRFLVELASGGWLPFAFVFSQAIVADTDVAPSLIRRLSAVATDPVTPGKSTGCCLASREASLMQRECELCPFAKHARPSWN